MEFNRLSNGLIECVISSEELSSRGIDTSDILADIDTLRCLYAEVLLRIMADYGSTLHEPMILQTVIDADTLKLIISTETVYPKDEPAGDEKSLEPAKATDGSDDPTLLPIDELQSGVINDLISAAENGNIVEHLRKYLNEDFLDSLIAALSESGLENLVSSFFGPPGADAREADITEAMAREAKEAKEDEMINRVETYMEHLSEMERAPVSSEPKKSHRRICVLAEFKSLDDVESAVSLSGLKKFAGKSWLFKRDERCFILLLTSGDLSAQAFRKSAAPLMNFYNAKEVPESRLFYLLEHDSVIIKENAVEALLK